MISGTKMKFVTTLLLILNICNGSMRVYNKQNTNITDAFKEILSKNFGNDTLMFYGMKHFDFNDFPQENAVIVIQKPAERLIFDKKTKDDFKWMSNNQRISIIFFVQDQMDVIYLQRLLQSESFSKGNLLIFFNNKIDAEITEGLLKSCRENGLCKIAFSLVNKDKNIELYSWEPFDENNFCGTNYVLKQLHSYENLFWQKQYNMKDCFLKLTYIKDETLAMDVNHPNPGIFISLFELIRNATGIKMVYENIWEFEQEFINEGKLSSALNYLANGTVDVLLAHLFIGLSPENTIPGPQIYTDDIFFTVHKARKLRYRNMTKPFETKIWILVPFVFIVLYLLKLGMKKFYSVRVSHIKIIFDILQLILNIPMRKLSNKASLRILMITYIFYCVAINALYLGKLSSIFTMPRTIIPNIELLYVNGIYVTLTYYIEKLTRLCSFVTNDSVAKLIGIYNSTQHELLKRTVNMEIHGTVVFKSTLKTYPAEAFLIHRFTTKMSTLFLCYYLRKHNIINEPIIYWTNEVLEKGFLSKWWADIRLQNTNYTLLRMNIKSSFVVLSRQHYEEPIYMLIIGYVLSTIALIFEIIVNKIINRVNKIKDAMPF